MIVPRTVINRLMSTAQALNGGSAHGVIVQDGDDMRVEADSAGREIVAYWCVGASPRRDHGHGAAPTLVVDTDVTGVLRVRASRGGDDLPLEITD